MIVKAKHGDAFYGIIRYALNKEGAVVLGPVHAEANQIARSMEGAAARNSRVKDPVLHMAIALHPEEQLDNSQWSDVAARMLQGLGYTDNRYIVIRHTDEPHDHIHVIASRVKNSGKVVRDFREQVRASKIAAELEQEYGLRLVAYTRERYPVTEKKPSQGEIQFKERTGEESHKQNLKQIIDVAMTGSSSVTEFVSKLDRFGVGVKANIGGDHVSGISFEFDGRLMKGSTIGPAYSWNGLLESGLKFDPVRDLEHLRRANPCKDMHPSELPREVWVELRQGIAIHRLRKLSDRLRPLACRTLNSERGPSFSGLCAVVSSRYAMPKLAGLPKMVGGEHDRLTSFLELVARTARRLEQGKSEKRDVEENENRWEKRNGIIR